MEELKSFPQWLLWKNALTPEGKPTKWPISPHTGLKTDITSPASWTTYENASEIAHRTNMGLGFVLTAGDPFFGIDLDDPYKNATPEQAQQRISNYQSITSKFDTYQEISPSGTGIHIWGLAPGVIWPEGKRRNGVEIYNANRFFTVTGKPFKSVPFKDCTYLATRLWEECGGTNGSKPIEVKDEVERYDDRTIYETARAAANGDKFDALWNGNWADANYPSQSHADFALIDMLGFYSRNIAQIRRLFMQSALGKRDKAKRTKYVDDMIKKSFDNQPVYLPLDDVIATVKDKLDASIKTKSMLITNESISNEEETETGPLYNWTIPQGLMGDIAEFVYSASPRPVKEIALAAAIGFMAGICGRSYNVSGTGLNQYVLILAGTGKGKEAAASSIDKLMRYVVPTVPAASTFIGPADIASGQALVKYIARNPCFVSIVGEFGLMLQGMCAYNASPSQVTLRKKLLELYNKSGEKDQMQPTVYSDKDKNTTMVQSPSFSLLGESTPETYYAGLDESMIAQGLLPRFMCVEYLGPRPPLNEYHQFVEPKSMLIQRLVELVTNSLTLAHHKQVINLQLDEPATAFARAYEIDITRRINNSDIVLAKELWNRAHLKMLKLSGLIAVGINMYEPMITLDCVKWAHELIEHDINNMLTKFEAGKIGRETGEQNQIDEVKKIIKDYIWRGYDATLQKYGIDSRMHSDRMIPLSYLQRRLIQKNAFKSDRIGATNALKRTLDALVHADTMRELRQIDVNARYQTLAKLYFIADISKFE